MILALDTATRVISLAVHDGHEVIAELTWRTDSHHTVELTAAVADLLDRAAIAANSLQAIAVALGPGSYTGLRIGLSLAKGLALASVPPIPLIGIPTLDITALGQPHAFDRLCVVSQAGRGRVNAGFYHWHHDGWQPDGPPVTLSWPDLVARLETPTQIAGEISATGRDSLASLGDRVLIAPGAFALRRAGFLAELACRRLATGKIDDPAALAPVYLQ